MKAAVVTTFDRPPEYTEFPTPAPADGGLVVDVLAAGLHKRVRSQADGSHYTSTDALPLVPGIDGVGRDADGTLRYFVLPDTTLGAMAERTLVDPRRSVVLPGDADPVRLAAVMNPAMSSWVALRQRIDFARGQSLLILGAGGAAGRTAIQVGRHLGAGRIVAAARDTAQHADLTALGADAVVTLDAVAEGADAAVVLDYLWGEPAATAMAAVVTARTDRGAPLTWVQIGAVAGPDAPIPSAALRACRLSIVGSGQGSVPTHAIAAELAELAREAPSFDIATRAMPLADVTRAWADAPTTRERIVLVP